MKLMHLAEGCIQYFSTLDTILLTRPTEFTARGSLQTTANLIDQGCRILKSSGRTWLFLVRYLLYGFTGLGLNPTKSHYYKAITCPVSDDVVDDVSVIYLYHYLISPYVYIYIYIYIYI